jgi:putative tryptophan/tyrosine transport system substrate-binding protein
VPIVYGYSGDPVAAGLADSFARPLDNMTGRTFMSVELNGKRIELLREVLPSAKRIAILANPLHPGEHLERADSEMAAGRLGLEVHYLAVRNVAELDTALEALGGNTPDAIIIFPDGLMLQQRKLIADFAVGRKIPVASGWAAFAQSGALLSYGPNLVDSWHRVAVFVDRILKGARPADLPVEGPTAFELIVNTKTARAIGVTIPAAILARADEVIE